MSTLSDLPGAEIALEVMRLIQGHDIRDSFTSNYATGRWNPETSNWESTTPHFVTYADCSDTFFWGSADADEVTAENLPLLAATITELQALASAAKPKDEALYQASRDASSEAYANHKATCGNRDVDEHGNHTEYRAPGFTNHNELSHRYMDSAADLFCARLRNERPQGAAYKVRYPESLWPLFNACGPERKPGLGNPREVGQ